MGALPVSPAPYLEGIEYTQLCQHYFKNLPASAVELFVMEYVRLGANYQESSRPFLLTPTNMAVEDYLEAIRRLVKEHSIVPRIPGDCLYERQLKYMMR